MTKFRLFGPVSLGLLLIGAVAFALGLNPGLAAGSGPPLPCRDGGDDCIQIGFTDAWFNGETVQLGFSHHYFCAQPPHSNAFPAARPVNLRKRRRPVVLW